MKSLKAIAAIVLILSVSFVVTGCDEDNSQQAKTGVKVNATSKEECEAQGATWSKGICKL